MQDKILQLLTKEDDVTWKSILMNLVKTEEMDPWDIDISLLAKKFLETIKALEKADFRVSGKVVLAAAVLLRMKSTRILDHYLKELDSMIAQQQADQEETFYEELESEFYQQGIIEEKQQIDHYKLIPRTPQPRKRKVSLYDLVDALNKALEVQERRIVRRMQYTTPEVHVPKKKWDLGEMIETMYQAIQEYYQQAEKPLMFNDLIKTNEKEEKVMVFMPLLHLSHLRKINLEQKEHFSNFQIYLTKNHKQIPLKQEE